MEKENGYMTVDDDTVNSIEEKMPIESEYMYFMKMKCVSLILERC